MHDSEPPTCSSHANKTTKNLPGNSNATTHGFYATAYTAAEVADLVTHAINDSLDDEIATARVALRRVLQHLYDDLDPREYAKLAALAFIGSRTIGRLMRDRRALSGDAADGIADSISSALDELSTELGIDV
jgi:hypothetical protein